MDLGSMRFKLGYSGYNYSAVDNWNNNQLLNWNNASNDRSSMNMFYLNGTVTLKNLSYINAVASYKTFREFDYNEGISKNYKVTDDLGNYGKDTQFGDPTYYHRDDGKQALSIQDVVYFTGHGYQDGAYNYR